MREEVDHVLTVSFLSHRVRPRRCLRAYEGNEDSELIDAAYQLVEVEQSDAEEIHDGGKPRQSALENHGFRIPAEWWDFPAMNKKKAKKKIGTKQIMKSTLNPVFEKMKLYSSIASS